MSDLGARRARCLGRRAGQSLFVMGDEAVAFGALWAGCDFFGGYPITPASEVAETMARELPKVGGYYMQFEDEIASIAAVIGASWAGARAMTATSGPGFSLMQENLGYAAMTETPCVVVDVQRSGPSTGQATKPAQGDFMQARWGTHGDHEIIALSPWSVQESFDLGVEAFALAEAYRSPVILLMDGVIGHLREPLKLPPYDVARVPPRRLAVVGETPFGGAPVPPMAQIGQGLDVHITGSTHRADGIRDVNSKPVHELLVRRLSDKITSARAALTRLDARYLEDAREVVVSFGASARPALGAVEAARAAGRKVGFIRLIGLWPFPGPALAAALARAERIYVPEMNLGQLCREIERFVDGEVVSLSKIGGVAHTVKEIHHAMMERGA